MSVRDDAIDAIKNGQMVVVNGESYTLNKTDVSKGLNELPPLEVFVAGDAAAESDALASLKNEKAELDKRLEALTQKTTASKSDEANKPEEEDKSKKTSKASE